MKRKIAMLLAAMAVTAVLAGGCTVSHGVFTGMSEQSSDTSLSASYASFDGSLSRRVQIGEGDTVTFRYEGGEGLRAAVKQGEDTLCEIADGTVFTAPEDGRYLFGIEGEAKNGAFTLSWEIAE